MADNTPSTVDNAALYAIETALGRAMTQAQNDLDAGESIRVMRAIEALRVVGPVCVGHTLTEAEDKFARELLLDLVGRNSDHKSPAVLMPFVLFIRTCARTSFA
ncbi:MAG: hypothetical protein AAB480_00595 [Patescibacteria group bacterium]